MKLYEYYAILYALVINNANMAVMQTLRWEHHQ